MGQLSNVNPVNPCLSNYGVLEEKTNLDYLFFDLSTRNPQGNYFSEQILPNKNSYNEYKKIIETFGLYEENWDGYGALPIHSQTKENALKFLEDFRFIVSKSGNNALIPLLELTPNTNGTINFEWEDHDKIANLDIGKTRISFFITQPNHEPIIIDDAVLPSYRVVIALILGAFSPTKHLKAISNIKYSNACDTH